MSHQIETDESHGCEQGPPRAPGGYRSLGGLLLFGPQRCEQGFAVHNPYCCAREALSHLIFSDIRSLNALVGDAVPQLSQPRKRCFGALGNGPNANRRRCDGQQY